MTARDQFREARKRWLTLGFYEQFEQAVLYILTALIAVVVAAATLRLALAIVALVMANLIDPGDYTIFQAVFGMIFTVLIALEFKHSLLVVLHSGASIVQLRSVILIALLALVRKLIIVDLHTSSPSMIAALAGAALALGLVYWLVRDQDWRVREQKEREVTPPPASLR